MQEKMQDNRNNQDIISQNKRDKSEDNVKRAIGLMVCAGLLFGISSAFIKAGGKGLPTLEVSFFRSGVGFFILLGMFLCHHPRVRLGSKKKWLFGRAVLGTLGLFAYVWSINHIDLALANGLNQTSPIFVSIFAALFLQERFHWTTYLCVFTAFLGILFVVSPDFSGIHAEALVALASGIVSAMAYTIVRTLQKTESTETVVFWFLGFATFAALVFSWIEPWQMPSTRALMCLLTGGLTSFGGQMLMTRAYHYAAATIVAPFIYVSTISSLFIAFFFWGELPQSLALIGCCVVIISAIAIGILPKYTKRKKKC